jgi:hypothetical protein
MPIAESTNKPWMMVCQHFAGTELERLRILAQKAQIQPE